MLAIGALPAPAVADPAPISAGAFAGTYAGEGGAGLVALTARGGAWSAGDAVPAIRNASFGVASPRHRLRYLVDEQQRGSLGVYDAALHRVATSSTLGADPCHVALAPDGGLLAAANYSSGSVALWSLDRATGLPRGEPRLVTHRGSGPNAERQSGPHAHWVGFSGDGRMLHAVDLGADAIFVHHVDRAAGRIVATRLAYRAVAGSGPRHLVRHPRLPLAYLVAELANTVTVLRAAPDGTFVRQAEATTLPPDFRGTSFAAHIAVNAAGTRLYVSNRGHDSIAVFAIGPRGELRSLQHAACGGHWPRFFRLDERRGEVLVANQRSGGIARLALRPDGRLASPGPAVPVPGVAFVIA